MRISKSPFFKLSATTALFLWIIAGLPHHAFADKRDLILKGNKSDRPNVTADGLCLSANKDLRFRNITLISDDSVSQEASGVSSFETPRGKDILITVEGDLTLLTGPSAANAVRRNKTVLNVHSLYFTGDQKHAIVLDNSSENDADSLMVHITEFTGLASRATVSISSKSKRLINSPTHFGQVWCAPGSSIIFESLSNRVLPVSSFSIGKAEDASGTQKPPSADESVTIALDGGKLFFTWGKKLHFLLDGSHTASNTPPMMRIDGRGGLLEIEGKSVELSVAPSFVSATKIGHTVPLIKGDFQAEQYKMPHAIDLDGVTFEIELGEEAGIPVLYAKRIW